MNKSLDDRLYNLLPVLYRQRDLENGQALRALMALLENEFKTIETDTTAAYNNWFIQTCDEWVIPYIADLVGIRDMSQAKYLFKTQRRQVANTIAYRRRKGTLPVLEHVLRDATSWLVRAVESSRSAASAQHGRYARPDWSRTIDMRSRADLAHLKGLSNPVSRTVDVHNVTAGEGQYGLDQIRLFFWRLRSYLIKNSPAHAIGITESTRHSFYTFDPLGRDIPLFNYPQFISEISQRAEDAHMPLRLTRDMLAVDLKDYAKKYHARRAEGQPGNSTYYGPDRALNVIVADVIHDKLEITNIPPGDVISMDLSEWPAEDVLQDRLKDKKVAIDVNLGRFFLLTPPSERGVIKVNYCYGLSDEIGGGPYRRSVYLTDAEKQGFQQEVAKGTTIDTLKQALAGWEDYCGQHSNPSGVIRVLDNGVYDDDIVVRLPDGAQLAIIADNGVRPTLLPSSCVNVISTATGAASKPSEAKTARELLFSGFLVSGGIHIYAEEKSPATEKLSVTIGHCTLMQTGLKATLGETDAKRLEINLDHCIVGPLYVPATLGSLTVTDSIIDHAGLGAGYAIAGNQQGATGPAVNLKRVTVFGQVNAAQVTACDVIFTQRIIAPNPTKLDQQVKFSYIPEESVTPTGESYRPVSKTIKPPVFTSTQFGDPAYAQLSEDCPVEIRSGASDGSEMGAFHQLHSLEAEANIPVILREYLPVDLEASITYMT